MDKLNKRPVWGCLIVFFACAAARIAEYFIIRTDETAVSENFLHKVFGIILLTAALKYMGLE